MTLIIILSSYSLKSDLQFVNGASKAMGKKKVMPKQLVRKSSNGMVWPLQQIPMFEVSYQTNTKFI